MILGVGLGGMPAEEHARFGEDPDDRIRARSLDEGLDILVGLWSGQQFSYLGEVHKVENAVFLPTPLQEPRIPVWIAGSWPNQKPFRRAAKWDGVIPQRRPATEGGMPRPLMPEEVPEMIEYTKSHRGSSDSPFDIALSAYMPADPSQARDLADAYEAVGATWLLEFQPTPDSLSKRLRALRP